MTFSRKKDIQPALHVFPAMILGIVLAATLNAYVPALAAESGDAGAGELVAFFSHPHDPVSGRITGRLVAVAPPDRRGYSEIVLRDDTGLEHAVAWKGSPRRPYFVLDREYDVIVENYTGDGRPSSSIVIRDKHGLLFAGASDSYPGGRVLASGLRGFHIGIGSAPELAVDHNGASVTLHQGESARLGVYEIVCLSIRNLPERGTRIGWVLTRNDDDFDEGNFALALPGDSNAFVTR